MGNRDVTKITSKTCIDKTVGTKWVRVNVGTSDNYLYLTANSSTLIASHPVSLTGSGSYRCITTFTLYAKNKRTNHAHQVRRILRLKKGVIAFEEVCFL